MFHDQRWISARLALRLAMSALIMSLVVSLSAIPLTSSIRAQEAGPQSTNQTELRQYSLELVNQSRAEEGLAPLELEPTLNRSASSHAMDMLERDYFAHVSPDGEDVMDRYLEAGGSRCGWFRRTSGIAPTVLSRPVETRFNVSTKTG